MRNPFESPALLSQAHPSAQIEDYLDHLCAPLVRKTTYEQRLAIRDEVRSHLLVLAAGHEELGSSQIEAIQAAMNQFGDPKTIGCSLVHEYQQPFTLNKPLCWALLHALLGGLVASLVLITLDCLLWTAYLDARTALLDDCVLGMATGWIPGLQLFRRPATPSRAGLRMGGFYAVFVMTPLMALNCFFNGRHQLGRDVLIGLSFTFLIGAGQAVGGALMARLFRHLERFAPQTKRSIAP